MVRHVLRKTNNAKKENDAYYIDFREYTAQVVEYKEKGFASDRLGELWFLHVERCGSTACFKNYTYLEEMKGKALLFLVRYSRSFKPEKAIAMGKEPNAFAYCTSIIINAFKQVINKEKKHSILKDNLMKIQQHVLNNLNSFAASNNKIDDFDLDPVELVDAPKKKSKARTSK